MNFVKLASGCVKSTLTFVGKHRSEILLGLGVASTVGAVGLGIRAGKRIDFIENTDRDLNDEIDAIFKEEIDRNRSLPVKRLMVNLKYTWTEYVPPVLSGVASIACFSGAYFLKTKECEKLAAACVAAETLVTQYQDQFVEPRNAQERKRNREVDEKFMEEAEQRYPLHPNTDGDCLFFDAVLGMDIWTTEKDIELALAKIQSDLMDGIEAVDILDFYNHIPGANLGKVGELATHFGWIAGGATPNVSFTAQLRDGKPIGVIHYNAISLDKILPQIDPDIPF